MFYAMHMYEKIYEVWISNHRDFKLLFVDPKSFFLTLYSVNTWTKVTTLGPKPFSDLEINSQFKRIVIDLTIKQKTDGQFW